MIILKMNFIYINDYNLLKRNLTVIIKFEKDVYKIF